MTARPAPYKSRLKDLACEWGLFAPDVATRRPSTLFVPRRRPRRSVTALAAAFVAVVFLHGANAPAQTPARQVRVGVLIGGIAPDALHEQSAFLALRDALARLGYREGHNVVLEARSAERQTDLAGPAQELVRLKVSVIVAGGVAAARAAKAATESIPIVGVGIGGDPIAMGLAQSIQHPGGNFT